MIIDHDFILLGSNLKSQELFKINGQIKDSQNTAIPFAAIYCDSLETGSESDENGNFEIELPLGDHKLTAYAIGYTDIFFNLDVKSSMQYNITLKEVDAIGEVVIQGRKNVKVESVQMSTEKITMEEAKKLPALFGEVDIIKSLQLKPGISSGGEGTSGINVRGGGQDQNLFLFDGATIYNASHLFGFFSTFNTDAIEAVEVYKGGFPARYGGRLSSVLDISQKKGSKDTFDVSGGLGLIASRLSVSGPIIKDKLSFLVSGRRTYVDLFTNAINKSLEKSNEKENEELIAKGKSPESFSPIPSYFFMI